MVSDERHRSLRGGVSGQTGLCLRPGWRASRSSWVAARRRQMGGHLQAPLVALGAGVAVAECGFRLGRRACGDVATGATRISPRCQARQRLVRKPKWRTPMKPLGRTWSRKRRTSSSPVSASRRLFTDPSCGAVRRHRLHENALRNAVNQAARQAGIMQRVGTHTPAAHPPLSARGLAKAAQKP